MQTIFSANRKRLHRNVYYVRVCSRKDGIYRYVAHYSPEERAHYEEYNRPEWQTLYRINVKPKPKTEWKSPII